MLTKLHSPRCIVRHRPQRWRFGSNVAVGIAALVLAAGCAASADNVIEVALDEDFQLRAGQSALQPEAELRIGFVEVVQDSRCGKGEVCFSEGDGVVRIWLQKGSEARQQHDLHTASHASSFAELAGYRTQLVELNPQRISGVVVTPGDYVAVLRIARSATP